MEKIRKKAIACLLAGAIGATSLGLVSCGGKADPDLLTSYSFEDTVGSTTFNAATGKYDKINYVFNAENAEYLVKQPSDPMTRVGVSGKSLYLDGFSTEIIDSDFEIPRGGVTFSAWVAPRTFEYIADYEEKDSVYAAGQPRLTSVINKGNIAICQGFELGYGKLGMWGLQLALYSKTKRSRAVYGFYDPINTLPLYEWTHIAATYDGDTGYIALFFNGEKAYEDIIPELANTEIINTTGNVPLRIGGYSAPKDVYGIKRQFVGGLMDEVRIYGRSYTPVEVKSLYKEAAVSSHPTLDYSEVALDPSVYEGDRYRPQYHAIPPAIWMNEPHAPFYYKGRYHVFYQASTSGPLWSDEIRWGHIVSDDMIHWEYVKEAVVPNDGVCPKGVWTGGATIGPDGAPWLVVTAGTDRYGNPNHGGQNIAFAHPVDPDDPNLTEWVLEDTLAITQVNDDSMGEREQFRDPFVWYDDETEQYLMLVSSSVPGAGGTANIFSSYDMHDWEHHGFLYECPYPEYAIAGEHWECTTFLPVSTKDGKTTKYVLFDTPQYVAEGKAVESYYWIGTFDKENYRFLPDSNEPKLFDFGTQTFNGQNGVCYLTEQQQEQGLTYEQGRSVVYAIAQGKDAGTMHNYYSGWAHSFAFPLDLWLSDDGTKLMRAPITELSSLDGTVAYEYAGEGVSASTIDAAISAVRGDTVKIEAEFTIAPSSEEYSARIGVRYNNNSSSQGTERTFIEFANGRAKINRDESSMLDGVVETSVHEWDYGETTTFKVTVLLDRSMLEVYINDEASASMRIYPKYADSDHFRLFDDNAGMSITKFKIVKMKSAYSADGSITPPYFGNVGNLADSV